MRKEAAVHVSNKGSGLFDACLRRGGRAGVSNTRRRKGGKPRHSKTSERTSEAFRLTGTCVIEAKGNPKEKRGKTQKKEGAIHRPVHPPTPFSQRKTFGSFLGNKFKWTRAWAHS